MSCLLWSPMHTFSIIFNSPSVCSTAIDLWVFEVLSQSVVPPPRVAGVLNEDKSKLALHFAGFTLLNVSTNEGMVCIENGTQLSAVASMMDR